ncbi:MAG: DUF932 domain-containing protein [Planctomycetes bacterium]|nr:DUF932 domain-containing protein [Planctomycetota bacterium]
MTTLMQASRELFRRPPDERFANLAELSAHCRQTALSSVDRKESSAEFRPVPQDDAMLLRIDGTPPCRMNDWSFSQLCSLAGVAKATVNRLRPMTAAQVLTETLAERTSKELDLQALVYKAEVVRSINSVRYRRLWNADVVAMLMEFGTDFTPPQPGANGGTGLYAGEQDMFCFLIEPLGWVEIGDKAFAPGFFVWNSEVGRRTIAVSTFWYQSVCANHIVWDATDVTEFTRRHIGNVYESLAAVRTIIQRLVDRKHQRRDTFARVIGRAMRERYGRDGEEVATKLMKAGFAKELSRRATELARQKGGYSIWAVVEAITQLNRETPFAGRRNETDQKASQLLSLAA